MRNKSLMFSIKTETDICTHKVTAFPINDLISLFATWYAITYVRSRVRRPVKESIKNSLFDNLEKYMSNKA